jgi:hypothetical protein
MNQATNFNQIEKEISKFINKHRDVDLQQMSLSKKSSQVSRLSLIATKAETFDR